MLRSPQADPSPIALGLAGVILGTMGNVFCFLPILGIPLGVCGLLFSAAGGLASGMREPARLRWAIAGLAVSCVALANGFALAYVPLGYEPSNAVQPLWQTPPDRPFVPPPAMPGQVYQTDARPS